MNKISAHLKISGKVQGVFFRAMAKKVAEKNNLTGWIKNLADGNVEAIVSGDKDSVERFMEWCKQGPENAQVQAVNVHYVEEKIFKEFTVKRE
ncbi:MAG: acylphosphatase [Bacteroidota bacterium]|nr:acylphosphatase [Bacteroidota bacterium]